MTPDKLPQEIADKIKSDATAYSDIPRCIAYTQGATAWATWKVKHDELQVQAQRMADTLEQCSNVASWMDDPYRNKIIEIVSKALQQFKDRKGKESVVGKCVKCGRHYTHANESGMCNKCGKEVENE